MIRRRSLRLLLGSVRQRLTAMCDGRATLTVIAYAARFVSPDIENASLPTAGAVGYGYVIGFADCHDPKRRRGRRTPKRFAPSLEPLSKSKAD